MARIHCEVCGIIIGQGYVEVHPVPSPDGKGFVCWRCYEYLRRCAARGVPMAEVVKRSRLDLRAERFR
jgi:hypothetical protein